MGQPIAAPVPDIEYKSWEEDALLDSEGTVVRAVVVDDQAIVRTAVKTMLTEAGIEVIGEADDGEAAVRLVTELAPEVVVMDLGLPGISGIEATRLLATLAPVSRVLVLTGSADQHDVFEAILAGACGYLTKDAGAEEIGEAVRAAAAGESVISRAVAGRLLNEIRGRDADEEPGDAIRATLTHRELEVLKLVASGKENNEIARNLFISPKTVQNHMSSILTKLQLENRIQAAVAAVRSGIV
jgi:DNA-binding NarL/FixJ family response regulator